MVIYGWWDWKNFTGIESLECVHKIVRTNEATGRVVACGMGGNWYKTFEEAKRAAAALLKQEIIDRQRALAIVNGLSK
jgi:hypothetical protein